MVDYKISINNGSIEQNYEFRKLDYTSQWDLYLNGVKSPYSIKLVEDNDFLGYELYKGDEPKLMFEFENGGLSYIPNLLEVITSIIKLS